MKEWGKEKPIKTPSLREAISKVKRRKLKTKPNLKVCLSLGCRSSDNSAVKVKNPFRSFVGFNLSNLGEISLSKSNRWF